MKKVTLQKAWQALKEDVCGIVQAYRLECIFAALGMLFASAIFWYADGKSLTAWAVELWDAIASGRLLDFGTVTAENARNAFHGAFASTSILSLLPGMLWNFPIWLTHPLDKNPYIFSFACMMWAKLMLILYAFIAGLSCYRIVAICTNDSKLGKTAAILFWGSATLMISIGNCGQDEIIYIAAFLGAVRAALSSKWIYALVCMSAAVTCNPAMLLPCLFVIVFHSKKIVMIAAQTAALFIPSVLERLLFREHFPGLSTDVFFDWFFARALIPGGNTPFSIFAVIFLILLATLFFNQYEKEKQRQQFFLYSIACLMTVMCLFSNTTYYRLFLCIPFLSISVLLIADEQKRAAGIAGLCVFEAFRILVGCFSVHCLKASDLYPYVRNILGVQTGAAVNVYTLLIIRFPFLEGKEILINSVVGACALWLLWLTCPKQKQKLSCNFSPRFMIRLYTLCPLAVLLLFCGMLIQTDITQVKIEANDTLAPAITGSNCLEEYYRAVSNTSKANITVRTVTWNRNYPEDQVLYMDIVDAEMGTVVGNEQVLANQLKDNQEYTFRFKHLKMEDGRWYIFRLYAPEAIEAEEHYLYVLRSDEGTANLEQHYAVIPENGQMVETNYDFTSQIVLY